MEEEENDLALNSNTRPYRERGESLSFEFKSNIRLYLERRELNSNTRLHRERGENIRFRVQ